ncbi:cytochrome c3 family protein [Deferribacteres bacterium DY0037]|nr:cytochrome c3 family protein [Denitrovibrio acetiphilus]
MKIILLTAVMCIAAMCFAEQVCLECHQSVNVLPSEHEKVNFQVAACTECHVKEDVLQADPFAAGMHIKHAGEAECNVCHVMQGASPFGLQKGRIGEPTEELELITEKVVHWQTSQDLDNRHAKAEVFCNGCHGIALPEFASEVSNVTCLGCHGELKALQKKTESAEHKDMNPHKSHLGDIACTVCHHIHTEQTAYCVNCHPKFTITMP